MQNSRTIEPFCPAKYSIVLGEGGREGSLMIFFIGVLIFFELGAYAKFQNHRKTPFWEKSM
jgi:hypothetical protein